MLAPTRVEPTLALLDNERLATIFLHLRKALLGFN